MWCGKRSGDEGLGLGLSMTHPVRCARRATRLLAWLQLLTLVAASIWGWLWTERLDEWKRYAETLREEIEAERAARTEGVERAQARLNDLAARLSRLETPPAEYGRKGSPGWSKWRIRE